MSNYLLGFILVGLVGTLSLDILIRKKHNIVFGIRLYKPVNNTHKWIENTLLIVFIFSVLIAALSLSYIAIYVLLFCFLTILMSIRTVMEYKKGIEEEKEYIISFVWAIGYSVIFIGSAFFMF
ncbi:MULTISPECIES: DUF4181 domain-containing protein [Virgibacillus]|uniref:DUF4181 domain-containing protein n=2 Tax=Bacillaceae TaxID=186817 RepID=A0A024QC22_9BACI|nr:MULTISPECIES: DUF4181 domain-containing protein [Virgibacillus]CDQ40029.1 hypothetical protein BN990_02347 [Virgibacillus massiliensis]